MPLRFRNLTLQLDEDETLLPAKLAARLHIPESSFSNFQVVRRSIDARKKPKVLRVYTVEFSCPEEQQLLASKKFSDSLETFRPKAIDQPSACPQPLTVAVVGMGPCGLLAAYRLASAGARVTLLDMGDPVEERMKHGKGFWGGGSLDPESNVQFGEGGAGTFSDGKLSTRLNHPRIRDILRLFVECGADPDILINSKPHVGTDRLRKVLIRLRQRLQSLNVQIHYRSEMNDFNVYRENVSEIIVNQKETHACDAVILAPGHSASRTFEMLMRKKVYMEPKAFAMGVRVEHPATLINKIQFGHGKHPCLPAADYALSYNDSCSGRGIYSFCMCPGGEVINASSEKDGVVVNGMSYHKRGSDMSNSALVVSVREDDFLKDSPLDGLYFQRYWERKAFSAAGSNHHVPAQGLMSFLGHQEQVLSARWRPGIAEVCLADLLPDFVVSGLRTALPFFDRKMRGFVTAEASLYGVETRTSSPVRIVRNKQGESVSHPGLFPSGEGAGYAGGIMSAALDGMRAADAVLSKHHLQE